MDNFSRHVFHVHKFSNKIGDRCKKFSLIFANYFSIMAIVYLRATYLFFWNMNFLFKISRKPKIGQCTFPCTLLRLYKTFWNCKVILINSHKSTLGMIFFYFLSKKHSMKAVDTKIYIHTSMFICTLSCRKPKIHKKFQNNCKGS